MERGLRFDANLKWLFTELPFEQRFDAAAAAGFRAVEFASPYEFTASRIRRLLDDAGLAQILINTPVGPLDSPALAGYACLPGAVAEFRAGFLRALEYAGELEAQFVHVTAGIVPDGVSVDRAFAQYVVNVAWAAEQAKGTGVRLLLEAQNKVDVPGFILATQDQAAAVAAAIDPDVVGLLMDFYHLQIEGGDLLRTFWRLRASVFHIQIADPPSRNEPGTGEIAWSSVFDELEAAQYPGWIGCEYRPRSGTLEGLDWMTRWL